MDDAMQEIYPRIDSADALVIATPVYFAGVPAVLKALYDRCPSTAKRLLRIPGANHNDIFARGLDAYLGAVKSLADRVVAGD